MPGLVLFKRRWAIASDDFVLPAFVCGHLHTIWCLAIVGVILSSLISPQDHEFDGWIHRSLLGLNVTLAVCQLTNGVADLIIAKISAAGTIIDDTDRRHLPFLLYLRCAILFLDFIATLAGIAWLIHNYNDSKANEPLKKCLLATITWQLISLSTIGCMIWACYDSAGRNWLILKRFEDRCQNGAFHRRSTARRRTWRQRKVLLAYQDSWRKRLRIFAGCCMGASEDDKAALSEVAKLFTEFFYHLDVVPSDLLAGFALLRRKQKFGEREMMNEMRRNGVDTTKILSGAVMTEKTRFMHFQNPAEIDEIRTLRYYMQYALAAYGWPFYLTNNKYGRLCELLLHVRCFPRPSCFRALNVNIPIVMEDNCLNCHSTAVALTLPRSHVTLIYACWHCHIGQTPFYVAVDHREKAVVICLRGTMSLNDFITDFNAQPENIPLIDPPVSSKYQAHRGIIIASLYVFQKLKSESILESAFEKAGPGYRLIIVGHSLGGGAATILAMLLRPSYPDLHCFVFAPPGGLLTQAAVELCKNYVTTLIIGKDLVARLALAQMETMRSELVRLLISCSEPKWRVLGQSIGCCQNKAKSTTQEPVQKRSDSTKPPASFAEMYPPGKVIHIVRSWTDDRSICKTPQYVAIRADNASFNEILISPVMIHDHMPEGIIEALDGLMEQIERSPLSKSTLITNRSTPDQEARSISSNFCDANEDIV